ncbi:MAG: VWA domain-containing protein [Candidatus Heimdallarchaeota archaeon]|nr:MAG: VWA domain-containing protein [Candidatus Heimdallarchaeota archaeon]
MEDLAEAAIAAGDTLPKIDKLDLASIERLTESAVEHENLPALMSLAKINKYAVSNTLNPERLISLGRVAGSGGVFTPRLFFIMRGVLDVKRRKILKRLTRTSILKLSLRIASEGLRGDLPVRGEYQPESDFDLDATMDQLLEKYPTGIPTLRRSDIIGIERRERKKNGVLIVDASGSMMGERNINAALSAAVMAYSMRHDKFGVIAFNTRAFLIKGIKDDLGITEIMDKILDLEAVGYTNIEDGLKVGALQLRNLKTRFKWAILLSDGAYNKGNDPRYLCRQFEKLHVLNLPGKKWGERVCQDLARLGGGRYVVVRSYHEVPRALMKILRSPW